ncbi:hypothetical protein KP509_12G016700 [Ceratopteris richardii]|uniref:AAA+ ATPase domain-containing protein n=1 Tax=Ceratopteris richardii TaxID=49495 RepID=A0A8T2TJC4_CERRI|nr:hypothetical protein KP509_12G016700 [Ceratopteris richardii]KAH7422608.1 hypothetical protein KP509_12G016700 [Ceratopteris richardii]
MASWQLVKKRGQLYAWQLASTKYLTGYTSHQGPYLEQRRLFSRYMNKVVDKVTGKSNDSEMSRVKEFDKTNPNHVINWYEQQPELWYNSRSLREYVRALVKANKLDNSELLAILQEGVKARVGEQNLSSAASRLSPQSFLGRLGNFPKEGSLGSASTPIHTVSLGGGFKQQLWHTVLYALFAFLVVSAIGALLEDKSQINKRLGLSQEVFMTKESSTKFSDVKGVDEAKEELQEIVAYLKDPKRFTRLGGKLPKGILLIGPPGTGKTMLARAIAGEAGVPFFYSSGSEFEEVYVGVGARRIRDLFAAAKRNAPCIVFIDEIDAVGGKRNPKDQQYARMTLNQLLVELDGFKPNEGIIVLGATNFPEALDNALVRPGRFDRKTVVPNPDIEGRRQILEVHMAKVVKSADVDLKLIARGTPGFSGADLANLVNIAALKAAMDGAKAVGLAELEYAKDKILMGSERKSTVLTEKSKKLTAYHESGHALVSLYSDGAMPIHKATIVPRGSALGMVVQLPEDDRHKESRKEMLAELAVCMGGRVAEHIIFGEKEVTTGAYSDFKAATNVAYAMVTRYGMSKAVGFTAGSTLETMSMETRLLVETEVRELLVTAYEHAMNILKTHEDELHMLAKALLERETMTAKEIKDLLAQAKSYSSVPIQVGQRQGQEQIREPEAASFPSPAAAAAAAAGAAAAAAAVASSAASKAAKASGATQQPAGS